MVSFELHLHLHLGLQPEPEPEPEPQTFRHFAPQAGASAAKARDRSEMPHHAPLSTLVLSNHIPDQLPPWDRLSQWGLIDELSRHSLAVLSLYNHPVTGEAYRGADSSLTPYG